MPSTKEKAREYRTKNREKILVAKKEYRDKNRDSINRKAREYFQDNKKIITEKRKNNKKVKASKKRYYEGHKREILLKQKIYRQGDKKVRSGESKARALVAKKKRHAERKKNDTNYKLACALRNRLTSAIKSNTKSGSSVNDLGCTIEFLKMYLESMFYSDSAGKEMSWDNYGEWHIDHIIPLHTFNLENREEFLIAANYKNLQPLWEKDHIKKHKKEK